MAPRDGLDFQHGLGHGVGAFLSVHECKPPRYSHPQGRDGDMVLKWYRPGIVPSWVLVQAGSGNDS